MTTVMTLVVDALSYPVYEVWTSDMQVVADVVVCSCVVFESTGYSCHSVIGAHIPCGSKYRVPEDRNHQPSTGGGLNSLVSLIRLTYSVTLATTDCIP